MNRVVIGVGSNIDPDKNIPAARERIAREHKVFAESQFVETEPVGFEDQPNFVNGAVLIGTQMERDELNDWLHEVERELGRVRGENRFGPRTIDLDVVVWNGEIVDGNVYDRPFLRQAVLELRPDLSIE